jgi:two-component system chemotaxis response regulator CheY
VAPRILLIDDIADTREPLAGLLRRKGYAVDEAGDGIEGLAVLRQHPDTAVIVLDLLMPRADGWWFREQQLGDPEIASVPVIVFTVAGSVDLVKRAINATAVLQKPGSIDALFAAIEACCGPGRVEWDSAPSAKAG